MKVFTFLFENGITCSYNFFYWSLSLAPEVFFFFFFCLCFCFYPWYFNVLCSLSKFVFFLFLLLLLQLGVPARCDVVFEHLSMLTLAQSCTTWEFDLFWRSSLCSQLHLPQSLPQVSPHVPTLHIFSSNSIFYFLRIQNEDLELVWMFWEKLDVSSWPPEAVVELSPCWGWVDSLACCATTGFIFINSAVHSGLPSYGLTVRLPRLLQLWNMQPWQMSDGIF